MLPTEQELRKYLAKERSAVLLYILVLSLTTAHFVHEAWALIFPATRYVPPELVLKSPAGQTHAPQAYRILMPLVVRFTMIATHLDPASILAGVDGLLLFITLYLLYGLTVKSIPPLRDRLPERGLHIALMLLFATASVVWVPEYLRPETLPAALFLALSLVLLCRSGLMSVLGVAILALLQAFSRADVPFCLGFAVLLAGFLIKDLTHRKRLWVAGVLLIGIAAAVQAYLQYVLYPHLTYDPNTPVVQLRTNLHLHMWSNALLVTLPVWGATLLGLSKQRSLLHSKAGAIPFAMGLLYLPIWLTVGLGAEVRIYVPVLLMMSPLAASAACAGLGWCPQVHQGRTA